MMGGRSLPFVALALAVLAAACSKSPSDTPTSPDFAPPVQTGCNTTALSNFIKTEFGNASNEAKLATDLKNYGAKTSQATYVGYQLLDAIALKYEIPANQEASRLNPSKAAIEILKCSNIGTAAVPTSFETQLGTTGAFAVRGFPPSDNRTVTSHDGSWILEPPDGQTWQAITTLATAGLHDSVDNLFLAHGNPAATTEGFTEDDLVGGVFDWHTIPTATFGSVSTSAATALAVAANADIGVVVGECPSASSYIQHNAANDNPEVLGFVMPSCYVVTQALREREPRTFAERIGRFFSPTPAFAALVTSTGTGAPKRTLSSFGLISPDFVNLEALFAWKKTGSIVGQPLNKPDTPKYQIRSEAGTVFLQDYVLIWLEAIGNSGINAKVCNNYAFTNANGIAQFPTAYPSKSGGYTFIARTTGTSSKPGVDQGAAPAVPAGVSLISPIVNVKNGTLPVGCSTFADGDDLPEPPGPNGFAP